MTTIDAILDQVDTLPSAPEILPKLMTVLNEPDIDLSQIVDLITYDPGLTARVLRLCNSASLAGATQVTNPLEAVNRLGSEAIYRMIAVAIGRLAMQPSRQIPGLEPEVLWRHSVVSALAAQLMAADHGEDTSAIFTAALLHDAGKIVMAEAFQDDYGRLLAKYAGVPEELPSEERARFNTDHAEVGGRLLVRWKFPSALASAVVFQHRPGAAGQAARLAAYVHLGDFVANLLDEPSFDADACGQETSEALRILELPKECLGSYRERTLDNFEFVNALCRV